MKLLDQGWVDAHSHLSDPRMPDPAGALRAARAQGIVFFLQGGVGPEDWSRQKELARSEPGILPVFGLHPYWIADHSEAECEAALDLLARELPQALALGETGLDFRPKIVKDSADRQVRCFEAQLEMAEMAKKPVVLHVVRAFDEALRVLDLFGTRTRGFVHAFTGSAAQAEAYLERGYLISVGGPLCRPDSTRLAQAVAAIPMESLLVETDSPDQPPPGIAEENNTPETILRVADRIAEIKRLSRAQVLDNSRRNLRKLLGIEGD
jgi:TatD DNase family protein